MGLVRDHLRQARQEYAAIRYPDDLAAEVLARPRRWLWRAAVASCAMGGLAAALVLVVLLHEASQPGPRRPMMASSAPVRHVMPVVPALPDGMGFVPVAAPMVPPAFPMFAAPAPSPESATGPTRTPAPSVASKADTDHREQT